jgi:peptidoglycan/xylan/chitin deacetylase (PgdA/CDA1 family)
MAAPGVAAVGASFVISLDLELHWGVRDKRSVEAYRENLLGARAAIPRLLALFASRGVHATWATVGMLFAADRDELTRFLPARRARFRDPGLDAYRELPGVGRDEGEDPFHFAASLVERIAAAPGQELATHTFSHYCCLEPGADPSSFRADLDAAIAIAARRGVTLRSIVFPRNQYDEAALRIAAESGLEVFRGARPDWMYRPTPGREQTLLRRAPRLLDAYLPLSRATAQRPRSARGGLVDVPGTRFLRPWSRRLAALEPLRVGRVLREMTAAARFGGIFHLWWHPHNFGRDLERNMAVLETVLGRFGELERRHGMTSQTMAEAAATLTASQASG